MTLTVQDCINHIRHATGDRLSEGLSPVRLVNEAGRWLVGAHEWRWLAGAQVFADLVADQDYITLPADFRSIIDIDMASLSSHLDQGSLSRLLELRKNTAGSSVHYEGSIEWDHSQTPPVARFALWPKITTDETKAVILFYRRDWRDVTGDGDTVHIPPFMEPLFTAIVRAYALGWEDEDEASLSRRLVDVQMGPLWSAARRQDAHVQRRLGVLQNGMAGGDTRSLGDYRRFLTGDAPT